MNVELEGPEDSTRGAIDSMRNFSNEIASTGSKLERSSRIIGTTAEGNERETSSEIWEVKMVITNQINLVHSA